MAQYQRDVIAGRETATARLDLSEFSDRYDRKSIETELTRTIQVLSQRETELEEVQTIVSHLRGKVMMLKGLLGEELLMNDLRRTPKDMLRPEYKGKKLGDIVKTLLSQSESPLTPTEIASFIYNACSQDEFDRARNSLAAEMRAGAKGKNPKWRKVGRSAYRTDLTSL